MTEITIENKTVTRFSELHDGEFFKMQLSDEFVLVKLSFRDALFLGGPRHCEHATFTVEQQGLVRYGEFSGFTPVYRFKSTTIFID